MSESLFFFQSRKLVPRVGSSKISRDQRDEGWGSEKEKERARLLEEDLLASSVVAIEGLAIE